MSESGMRVTIQIDCEMRERGQKTLEIDVTTVVHLENRESCGEACVGQMQMFRGTGKSLV